MLRWRLSWCPNCGHAFPLNYAHEAIGKACPKCGTPFLWVRDVANEREKEKR